MNTPLPNVTLFPKSQINGVRILISSNFLPNNSSRYPDDSHVGIVGGRDANGDLLIIHCASGHNNVVITGLAGFTAIGRPMYYTE